MGGEYVSFYRSVLANISPDWKTILNACKETDTILLPPTEKGEFWDEAENYLFCKEKTKHQLLNEGQNKRKFEGEEPLAIEPCVESNRALEKTCINYDTTNEQANMITRKHSLALKQKQLLTVEQTFLFSPAPVPSDWKSSNQKKDLKNHWKNGQARLRKLENWNQQLK